MNMLKNYNEFINVLKKSTYSAADIDITNHVGRTALDYAKLKNNTEVVDIIEK